jgi:predicted DNA binding CopG/RHH family protein
LRKDYTGKTMDQLMADIVQQKLDRIEMKRSQPARDKAYKQHLKNENMRIYEELISRVKDDDFGVMY